MGHQGSKQEQEESEGVVAMRSSTPYRASDATLLALWRSGKDTNEIAKLTWEPESSVAARLPDLLALARQDREWTFDRTVGE